MAPTTLTGERLRRWYQPLLLALISVVLLASLTLLSLATQHSGYFGQIYSWLLVISLLGVLALLALIGHGIWRLALRLRQQVPGARLTLRLTLLFVLLSVVPVSVVYYFSMQFLQRGIDSWFNIQVEEGLNDALNLSRSALDLRMREVVKQTHRIGDRLEQLTPSLVALTLADALADFDVSELTLFEPSGAIVATVSPSADTGLPDYPPSGMLPHVIQGNDYVDLDLANEGYALRVLVPVVDGSNEVQGVLQARFPIPERLNRLSESVTQAYDSYRQLLFLRTPLKASFIFALSLVLLTSVLAAIAAALFTASRVVQPIRELAEGTRAVAAGHFDRSVALGGNHELSFLVSSFNQMTRSLAHARDLNEQNQRLLERQRAYLEGVLARLSSGVITLDQEGRLRTANPAASQILGVDFQPLVGTSLTTMTHRYGQLRDFWAAIVPQAGDGEGEWRREIALFARPGRRILLCRGSDLLDPAGLAGGRLVVFDDVTQLVQAQRDAAWAEVARRLAHEIKNPLTPILLSTERIRHKLLHELAEPHRALLDRKTHTIIEQVTALKEMVDAFNDYARPTALKLRPLDLNRLLREVVDLYRDNSDGVAIELNLAEPLPGVAADAGRLRQLLHNLLKNSLEAVAERPAGQLVVTTQWLAQEGYIQLDFDDNGPGFPSGDIGNLFEPYVTTKPKGTGLGLAIVRKIIEEHGGDIRLDQSSLGGARVRLRLSPAPDSREQ